MIVTVCDKDTGRKITMGHDAPGTKVTRLIDEGHTRVESEPPSDVHCWNGSAWVIDAELQAQKEQRDAVIAFARTDRDIPRLTEDLIDLLVAKGVVTLDELPEPAATKFRARKELRG